MSIASAHLQKYSVCPDGHVEYFIKVVYLGREWPLHKRYKDFSHFDTVLRAQGIILTVELPPRSWWNKLDPNFLANRYKLLQLYIDCLFRPPLSPEHSLVREFLEVDNNNLVSERKCALEDKNHFEKKDRLLEIAKSTGAKLLSLARPSSPTGPPSPSMRGNRSRSFSSQTRASPLSEPNVSSIDSRSFSVSASRVSTSWGSGSYRGSPSAQHHRYKSLLEACASGSVQGPEWQVRQLTFDRLLHKMSSPELPVRVDRVSDISSSAFMFEEQSSSSVVGSLVLPKEKFERLELALRSVREEVMIGLQSSCICSVSIDNLVVHSFEASKMLGENVQRTNSGGAATTPPPSSKEVSGSNSSISALASDSSVSSPKQASRRVVVGIDAGFPALDKRRVSFKEQNTTTTS
jgi:hypothetical protein